MKEIKKGYYQLTISIVECWKIQGHKYIKGKLSELFGEENEVKYVNIKSYWKEPHHDENNLFVMEINSNEIFNLLEEKERLKYIVNYQQL